MPLFDKSFMVEMNETPSDCQNDFSLNKDILQSKNRCNMSQTKAPHQGSLQSLESGSFVNQSEVQPLTEVHVCCYDECHKFRQTTTEKEVVENPSSPLKDASLVLVIVLLILWIIIYTALSQLKVF